MTIVKIMWLLGLWGGLCVAVESLYRAVSVFFGRMEYQHDVTSFDEISHKISIYTVWWKHKMTLDDSRRLRMWLSNDIAQANRTRIVAVVLTGERSVLLRPVFRAIHRAFTRTADDAIREWREAQG
jgi:hypothetical protein